MPNEYHERHEPENEDKFTPGPWEAINTTGAGWSVRRKFERPGYTGLAPICSMAWWQFDIPGIIDDKISEANARLIAGAPQMYALLDRISNEAVMTGKVSMDSVKKICDLICEIDNDPQSPDDPACVEE